MELFFLLVIWCSLFQMSIKKLFHHKVRFQISHEKTPFNEPDNSQLGCYDSLKKEREIEEAYDSALSSDKKTSKVP